MSDPNKSDIKLADEFNLKHRITGAAVLLFVGALVIPWLLGPPSEASKQPSTSISENVAEDISARDIENELLGIDRVDELPEETVYISKITPLDGSDSDNSANDAATKTVPDESKSSNDKAVTAKPEPVAAKEKAKKQDVVAPATETTAADKSKAKELDTPSVPKSDLTSKAQEESRLQAAREKELQNALEAEAQTAEVRKIQVGWVVQVGLYTEKVGVNKKMEELSKQGFSPQSTIVDTNRGPKTGTRVWLGPFQKRPDAEAKNKELKSKTGKDGFIRVYP